MDPKPRASVETPADNAPLLSEDKYPGNDLESGNPDHEPETVCLVRGRRMKLSQTYDPETYNPGRRIPWTPEPEPYDPDAYTA